MTYRKVEITTATNVEPDRILDVERISIRMPGEDRADGLEVAGAEYRCSVCGQALAEQMIDGQWVLASATGVVVDCADEDGHKPVAVPLAWANSLAVELRPQDDQIRFLLSVGTPLGAFGFSVRRFVNEDGEEEMRLRVPNPADGEPHMKLIEIFPGEYRIESK